MAWTSQRSGAWSRTSNNADSPWYDGGAQTAAASAPPDDTAVTIAAGHAVLMDYDSSGLANGYQTVTITSHATTPAMLYFANGTSGYLLLKTGYNIVGTNAATKGRLLANSGGVWGNTGALAFASKAVILLSGTAKIDALYLDIAMRATHPSNWFVETYKTAYTCADQTTGVNTSTGVVTFGTAPPTAGTAVRVKSSGTLPTGWSANAIYYVRTVSGNTCKLALKNADAQIIVPTATGSGTLTMYDGHTSTSTKTINVIQDVTGDAPWVTTAGHNRMALCNISPGNYDQQRDQLATVAAGALTLTTNNIDSTQHPLARIYLTARNVSIRSAGTTAAQAIVDYGAGTHAGVLDCEIVNTGGSGTTFYGYGVKGGTGSTISGIISGCANGVDAGTGHTMSGVICACSQGMDDLVSGHAVPGTIIGCGAGLGYTLGISNVFSGLIAGCSSISNGGSYCTFSGTYIGFNYGVSYGYLNTISGSFFSAGTAAVYAPTGCTVNITSMGGGIANAVRCDITATITGAYGGYAGLTDCQISGTITKCDTGITGSSGILCGTTFVGCTVDISLVGGKWSGWGVTLGGGTQVDKYRRSQCTYAQSVDGNMCQVQIRDLAAYAGDVGSWCQGGTIKTNAGHTGHVLTAEDNRADVWLAIPVQARAGCAVVVTVTATLGASRVTWTDLPVFAIVDPAIAWHGTGEIMTSAQQVNDGNAQTHTLSYTPTHDRELTFLVRAKGGNSSGTGTETCTFTYSIVPAAKTTAYMAAG